MSDQAGTVSHDSPERSALAAEMAAAAGLTRLYNLEGGTDAWIKAGKPAEK